MERMIDQFQSHIIVVEIITTALGIELPRAFFLLEIIIIPENKERATEVTNPVIAM
jgi:hypothetical protein